MKHATNQDVARIMVALHALWAKSNATHMGMVDPMAAELSVRHAVHQGRGWLIGPYFVMVDHGQDWYSSKKFLMEQIIIRIEADDPQHRWIVEDVIERLPELRDAYGCDAIVVGDSQIGMMVPKYLAAGYTKVGVQLMKG